jgi:pyridoxamine 5'-phosphate oxidase
MIKFNNLCQQEPYLIFKNKYDKAMNAGQENVEAMAICSYNKDKNEIDSRFVNLKFIENNKFIFFSNYNSPKSIAFSSHNQVSALFFWSSIKTQIRIKSIINKTSPEYNLKYFKNRSQEKNALAISSNQSDIISNYEQVVKNYNQVKQKHDLTICPDYWGGFELIPYEIEFWVGDKNRLNKRNLYKKDKNLWVSSILQP